MSARVMTILSTFSPDLEIYSIDEAFLGMAGFGDCLEAHARALCAAVLQCTGIPVSVGIAPTKTLAKVANHIAKKDEKHRGAVLLLDEPLQIEALSRLNLTDLWGIAGRLAAKLSLLGIMSPLDLRRADPLFLRDRLGVAALRMAMELRGVACLDLEQSTPDRKSIMASRSFDREDVAAVVSDDQKERLGWDGVIGGRHAPVYHESPWEIARMEGHAPREARGTFRGIAVRRSANYAGPCACLTDGCSSVP
jgi:nucleotidyltransferase/DNA polymerase involved in DNA repair